MCELINLVRRTLSRRPPGLTRSGSEDSESLEFSLTSTTQPSWYHGFLSHLPKILSITKSDELRSSANSSQRTGKTSHLHSTETTQEIENPRAKCTRPIPSRASPSWCENSPTAAKLGQETVAARYDALRRGSSYQDDSSIAQRAARHFTLQIQEVCRCIEDAQIMFPAPLATKLCQEAKLLHDKEDELAKARRGRKEKQTRLAELAALREQRGKLGVRWTEVCQTEYSQHVTLLNVMETAMQQLRGLERELERLPGEQGVGGEDREAYRQVSRYVDTLWYNEWQMRLTVERNGWMKPQWPNVLPKRARKDAVAPSEPDTAVQLKHDEVNPVLFNRRGVKPGLTADALLYNIGILPDPED